MRAHGSNGPRRRYWAWMSQPRYISAATASVTNALAWWASRERVRAGTGELRRSLRIDLRLDDARGTVVDGSEHRDEAAVLARVTDEELSPARRGRLDIRGGGPVRLRRIAAEADHDAAFAAACATVSRSAKPSIRTTRSPGGRRTSTAGSWITP